MIDWTKKQAEVIEALKQAKDQNAFWSTRATGLEAQLALINEVLSASKSHEAEQEKAH